MVQCLGRRLCSQTAVKGPGQPPVARGTLQPGRGVAQAWPSWRALCSYEERGEVEATSFVMLSVDSSWAKVLLSVKG